MAENENLQVVTAFVEELANAGVRHVCGSPGSRSTPLTIAVARHPALQIWSLLDERSAGFFAYGLARRLQTPVALICTSGTATANYLPALMEARQSRVPLLVLTADRPPELQGIGANQTVDQLKLYGSHVKFFLQMPTPEGQDVLLRQARQAAWRAVTVAVSVPAGPVHVNWPFREPLVPPTEPNRFRQVGSPESHPSVKPLRGALLSAGASRGLPEPELMKSIFPLIRQMKKGLIVCGPQDDPELGRWILKVARHLDVPVLADPLSQLRTIRAPEAGVADRVIDSYDILFRNERWFERLQSDLIIRFGQTPTSKVLGQYLQAQNHAWQVIVDDNPMWSDPFFSATHVVTANPIEFCRSLEAEFTAVPLTAVPFTAVDLTKSGTWSLQWTQLNRRIQELLTNGLASQPLGNTLFEGELPKQLMAALPPGTTVLSGNSMPVRDFDSFLRAEDSNIRLLGNRGVSGIDGVVSTALGLAAASDGPVVLVIGDVSFYHDLNALLVALRHRLALLVVLVHNNGGGIFSFLPQASYPDTFEHFRTSHGLDFQAGVEMYGGTFVSVKSWTEFHEAVKRGLAFQGVFVVEIRTDSENNVQWHQALFKHVHDQLEAEL